MKGRIEAVRTSRGTKVRANPETQNSRAVLAQASEAPPRCPPLCLCDAVEPTQGLYMESLSGPCRWALGRAELRVLEPL